MEKYTNDAATTLNGAINNSVTSVVVTDASTFPLTGTFRIRVGSEIMKVTAVASNTFTVVRGSETTTAASHSNGDAVTHILTVEGLLGLGSNLTPFGVLASRPTVGVAGRVYYPTDSNFPQYDTGSAWRNMFGHMVLDKTIPQSATLLAGSWAWRNQGTATIVDTLDAFTITQPLSATENMRGIMKAAPATPYSFIAGIQGSFPENQFHRAGIFWHDGTKHQTLCINRSVGALSIGVDSYNTDTSYSASPASYNMGSGAFCTIFFKLRDNGTTRFFECSSDLTNWTGIWSTPRTTFLTPTHYGVFGNNNNNTFSGTKTKCFYIDETSP